jgi:LuxR family maltose regulon positive regulatory protein
MMAERTRILVERGAISRAREEVSTMLDYSQAKPSPGLAREEIAGLLVLAEARVALAEGASASSMPAMRELLQSAKTTKRWHTAFLMTLELANVASANGMHMLADRLLIGALKKGECAGMLLCWLDAGEWCDLRLRCMAAQSRQSCSPKIVALGPYLRSVVAHIDTRRAAKKRAVQCTPSVSEHLSARERAILALVARGHSNKRAARALRVAPETIKSHLKRVFLKLDAKTRVEAVMRAADLGQLIGVGILPRPYDS